MTDSLGSAQGSIELSGEQALRTLGQVGSGIRNLGAVRPMGSGFSSWVQQNQQHITNLGQGLTALGLVTTAAFLGGGKVALDFQAQMSAVGSVANATEAELAKLRDEALRLGSTTAFSASEAAQGMEIMLKAGAKVGDVMDGATEHVLNLAKATGTDVPLAAETAAAAVNIFGEDYETVANVMTQSANASSLSVNDWALAMKGLVPVAAASGMSIEQTAAAMMILADAGTTGEVASTALRNVILNLGDDANEGTIALNAMGIATRDAAGEQRTMADVTKDLAQIWPTLTDAQQDKLAMDIAGRDGVNAFNQVMDAQVEAVGRGSDAFTENEGRLNDAGTAADGASARMDNLKGSLDELFGAIETLVVRAFTPLLAGFRSIVDIGTAVVRAILQLPDPILAAVAGLTGLAGASALVAGGVLLALPKITELRTALLALTNTQAVGPALAAIRTSMLAMLGPIALVAVAIGALALAWKTDFLGIQSTVKGLFGGFIDGFRGAQEEAGIAADAVAQFAEATHVVDGITVYAAFRTNAEGEKEKVGEIIEATESLDGKTTRVLIKGEAGEYWATIDLATGEVYDAQITVTADTEDARSNFEKLNDGLQGLEDKADEMGIGWVAPITNGLQRVVSAAEGMWNAVSPILGSFKAQFDQYRQIENPIAAIFHGISGALFQVDFGSFQGIMDQVISGLYLFGDAFAQVGDAMGLFGDAIKDVFAGNFSSALTNVQTGFSTLGKSIQTAGKGLNKFLGAGADLADRMAKRFPQVGKSISAVSDTLRATQRVVGDISETFGFLLKGDLDTAWKSAGNAVGSFGNLARTGITGINTITQELGGILRNAVGSAVDWLSERFSAFSGTFERLGSIVTGVVDVVTSLTGAFSDLVNGDVAGFFSGLGDAAMSALGVIGDAFMLIPSLISDAFNAVNWGAVGSALLAGARAAVSFMAGAASAAWDWITDQVDRIPWDSIGSTLREGATTAVGYLRNLASNAWDWIQDQAGRIPWDTIGAAFRTGASVAAGYIKNAATGLWDWITEQASKIPWDTIGAAIRTGASTAAGYIKNAATGLWEWIGEQASSIPWDSIGAGIRSGASTAGGYVKNAATGIWSWIQEQAGTIPWDTIGAGMRTGANTSAGYVRNAATGIWDWIKTQAEAVDWPAIGSSLKTGFQSALSAAFSFGEAGGGGIKGLVGLGTRILAWVKGQIEGVEWESVGNVIGKGIVAAIAGFFGASVGLNMVIGRMVQGLISEARGANWEGLASAAWEALKAAMNATTDILTGIAEGIADALRAPIEQAFSGLADSIRPYVNGVIEQLNRIISAMNQMPGVDIPPIPRWLSDTEQAAEKAAAALEKFKKAMAGGPGANDGVPNHAGPGVSGAGTDTPPDITADPNIQEPKDAGGWISKLISDLQQVDQGLLRTNAGIGAFKGAVAGIPVVAQPAFAGLKGAFDTSVPPITTAFQTAPLLWQAPVVASLAAIKGSFDTNLPALAVTTLTNFAAAKSAAVTNADAMKAGVGTAMTAMSAEGLTQFQKVALLAAVQSKLMEASWSSSARTMASTTATLFNGMAVLSGLAFSQMTQQATNAANNMRSRMQSGMQGVVNAVRSGMSAAVSAARSAAGAMEGAGADAIGGLVRGARSQLGALNAVVNEAIAIFSQIPALGNSPWPMMIGAGGDAMDGLVGGWVRRMPRLEKSIDEVVDLFNLVPVTRSLGSAVSLPAYAPPYTGAGYGGSPSGATYIEYGPVTIGDIIVQGSDDPQATGAAVGDAVFERFQTAWTGVGKLK